ncbi:MAG: peptidoglycan bridge formation glycyltransferase FemA/FemB family protein [Melioribacteraceae bacterium]|nr:peptidoglycan bridge formation glycyltransferase FemA/FemB family protein [Melioribacteraceae bacterium]
MELETFVYNHPHANFFQSTKAYNYFSSIKNHSSILIVARNQHEIIGSLLAVLIKEGRGLKGHLSKRCIIWGGPLVKNDDDFVYRKLLISLNKLVENKAIYTEFRNLNNISSNSEAFFDNGYIFSEHLNYIVPIDNLEKTKSNFSKSKKRQISKSLNAGAIIIEGNSETQIAEFYQILSDLYKNKVGKPIPNFKLFTNFLTDKDLGKYFLILYDSKIVGGIMCPIYKDTIYEWYICGLDGVFDNLFPSVLATYAPIEYAARNSLNYFDFMGAGKPNEDYGVREFKSKFGGDLVNFGRFKRINSSLKYKLGELGVKILGMISR